MGKIIAVVNQKGGVGKTTTAINLAAGIALSGLNVLLADCDPQTNASSGLGIVRDTERVSMYDVLLGEATVDQALIPTSIERLSIIPSTKDLIGANFDLAHVARREFRLRDALQTVRDRFDFILLDCPPALDLLTLNALVASDSLLVPMQAEYFALEGISELTGTLDRIAGAFQPDLGLEGVVLTMYDPRMSLAQQVTDNLRSFFGDKLYTATIPRNVRVAEAPSHGLPVMLYDSKSRGAEAYRDLTRELLARNGIFVAEGNPAGTEPTSAAGEEE